MSGELRGFEPKVKVAGTVYDVQSGRPQLQISTARADTTADGAWQINVADKKVVNFEFKAIRKSTLNPHASPYGVGTSTGQELAIKYYPTGDTASDTTAWRFTMVLEEYAEDFNAEQGLVTLTARGKSTGAVLLPGES